MHSLSLALAFALALAGCSGDDDQHRDEHDDNLTDDGQVIDAPTDITLSSAKAYANLNGATVGRLTAVGQDAGSTVTFSLTGDAGGRFAITGDLLSTTSKTITNADSAGLMVTVRADTDSGGFFVKTFAITVLPTTAVSGGADAGVGSLRAAINGATDLTTIVLDTAVILSSPISISGKGITIVGTPDATISGGGSSDIFHVDPDGALILKSLDLGSAAGSAIVNHGTLVIDGVNVHDSGTSGARGGAIDNSGVATLGNCTVEGNAGYNAGGVANEAGATMHVDSCIFVGNIADGNSGGGLLNNGALDVINSIFNDNHADAGNRVGGGIAVFGPEGMDAPPVTTTLAFVTVVGNSAAAATGLGPGIYLGGNTTTHIRSSVIADNSTSNSEDTGDIFADAAAVLVLEGYVIVGDGDGTTLVTGGTNSIGSHASPIDPDVEPLTDHGGPLRSMPPLTTSPLLDAVPAAACTDLLADPLGRDVRGQARPSGLGCDIGATERP